MAEERLKAWEALFARALDVLDAAQRAGASTAGWSFGGGTALMRRYRHRISKDIDIFIPDPQLLGCLSPRLNAVSASLTADHVEEAKFLKLFLPQGEIDFIVSGSLTADPVAAERIGVREVLVQSSAEIIAKKLWHRGAAFTARDLFDFALIAEREPEAIGRVRHILAMRRQVMLRRLESRMQALREDFAALDALDFRPSFERCVEAIVSALRQAPFSPPHRVEQPRAGYGLRLGGSEQAL